MVVVDDEGIAFYELYVVVFPILLYLTFQCTDPNLKYSRSNPCRVKPLYKKVWVRCLVFGWLLYLVASVFSNR